MKPHDLSTDCITGTYDEVVTQLVWLAEHVAIESGRIGFPARRFVTEWLPIANKRLDGLCPDDYMGDIPARTIVAGVLAETVREHFKLEAKQSSRRSETP